MNNYLKVIVHHLFLALTAVLMMKQTLVMSGINFFSPLKFFIVFVSTIVVYQLAVSNISIPLNRSKLHQSSKWIAMMFVLIVALVVLVIKSLSSKEIILLLCVLLSCFGYFTSIGKWKGLRAVPGIKAVLLALAWSFVTVTFPLINEWNWNNDFVLLLQRFLFMLPICIVYNLRDVDEDRINGVVTIAIIAGEKKTKLIAGFCLLLFIMSIFFYNAEFYFREALLLSALTTAFVISKAKMNGSEFYYKYVIDGCMMLQGLLVIFLAK